MELKDFADERVDQRILGFFKIDECFIVEQDGDYELEVLPRLLKESTNNKLVPVLFQPIKIKLHLLRNASGNEKR